jgi:acyl-CoA thioester hydrolase
VRELPTACAIEVRVRYDECDPMRVVHHAVYPIWMEIARTELLRQRGLAYRDLEEQGVFFVVVKMSLRYRKPARYDEVLTVRVEALPSAGAKLEHVYRIERAGELLTEAQTTLVCVDGDGRIQRIPPSVL